MNKIKEWLKKWNVIARMKILESTATQMVSELEGLIDAWSNENPQFKDFIDGQKKLAKAEARIKELEAEIKNTLEIERPGFIKLQDGYVTKAYHIPLITEIIELPIETP